MTKAAADILPHHKRQSESGNAFIIVMLGVVLFAALMFTFTRSSQQGGENMSDRELQLTASDITSYAQELEHATSKVMAQQVSENNLSFDNTFSSDYANTNCTTDNCKVFAPAGGGAGWQTPPPGANDGSDWVITGANTVPGIGDDATPDLVAILPNVSLSLCLKINTMLNVANPNDQPPQDSDGISLAPFTGTFNSAAQISDSTQVNGVSAACVMLSQAPAHAIHQCNFQNPCANDSQGYFFYEVLLAR